MHLTYHHVVRAALYAAALTCIVWAAVFAASTGAAAGGNGRAIDAERLSTHAPAPAPPGQVRAARVTSRAVTLRWRTVRDARRYLVYRNGQLVGSTSRTGFTDRHGLRMATSYTYRVRARSAARVTSALSARVPVTTRHGGACDRYAAPHGRNDWPGSADYPYRTVTKLVTTLGPGVVGCIQGRFAEDVGIHRSGSRAEPAVLRARPGHAAYLRGRLWISSNANDVVVQDIHIDGRNVTSHGLPSPTIQGDRVRLLHNTITNRNSHICIVIGSVRGWGHANNVVLDANRVHHCGQRNPVTNNHHGIYVEGATGTRITNNVIYANADRGIQLYPNAQGSLIARNVIDGNGQGIIFSGAEGYASSGNRAVDNLITNSRIRYNIEYWWAPNNPVGRRNVARGNCLWNGRQGNVATPTVGLVARANTVAAPGYRNRAAGDFRATAASDCRRLLAGALPLAPW